MEQSETLSAGDDGPPVDDSGHSSSSKRLKTPSAMVLEQGTTEKLPQMVINNDLFTFIAKCIQADPDKREFCLPPSMENQGYELSL